MIEKSNHYSNKGGHLKRSMFNKALNEAIRQDLLPCRGAIFFCARRFAKRVPDDGKR